MFVFIYNIGFNYKMEKVHLDAVNHLVLEEKYDGLQDEVSSERIIALMSDEYDFFTIAALTEIELQESPLWSSYVRIKYESLSDDDKNFYEIPVGDLTAEAIFEHYGRFTGYEKRKEIMQDFVWGNIAILLAKSSPHLAFRCLAKITSHDTRLIHGSIALFQEPANLNIRELLRLSIERGVSGDRAGYYNIYRLHPDYIFFILGLAGDRAAADQALRIDDIHHIYKQQLRDLYGLQNSTSDAEIRSAYHNPPFILDDIVNFGRHNGKGAPLSEKDIRKRLKDKDLHYKSELELALGIKTGDTRTAHKRLKFGMGSNVMHARMLLNPLRTHGVEDFALEQNSQEANEARDWHNWGRVKLGLDIGPVEVDYSELVMRALAIPRTKNAIQRSGNLRVSAEQLLGINTTLYPRNH